MTSICKFSAGAHVILDELTIAQVSGLALVLTIQQVLEEHKLGRAAREVGALSIANARQLLSILNTARIRTGIDLATAL